MDNEPTHLDLFSGLGGFALAARRAGFRTVAFCESDPRCRRFLERAWSLPVHEDVKTLDGTRYRGVDLLTGGPPCQPSSRAGNQRGAEDDRWLWQEAIRVRDEVLPHGFLFETPLGILDLDFDGILTSLERGGYEVQTFDIPACAVGSPQLRHRLWIVGFMADARCQRSRQDEPQRRSQGRATDRRLGSQIMADAAGASGAEQRRESRGKVGRKAPALNSAESEGLDKGLADASSQPTRTGEQRCAEGSRCEHRDDVGRCGSDVADAANPRHEGMHTEPAANGRASERSGSVANASEQHRPRSVEETSELGRRDAALLADAERERRERRSDESGCSQKGQEWRETFDAASRLHWDAFVWVPCDDGYIRRAPDESVSVVNGLHRSLLAALGNSIVPQEAFEIIAAMKDYL